MENITDREFFEKLRDKADFRQNLRGNLVFRLKKLRGKSVFPEVEGKSCLSTKKTLDIAKTGMVQGIKQTKEGGT
jgi:hypothetical protein